MPRQKQPLGDPNATQLATARVTFDEGGHVEPQWLTSLADGMLTPALRDEVLAHLQGCERCRKVVAELAQDATVRHEPGAPKTVEVEAVDGGLVGSRVGEYEVLEKLSEGGMGVVYRGVHPVLGKPVAIKVLQPEVAKDADNEHRLLAEARAVSAIRHPNIVDVFAFGKLPDGRQYFVMELLSGQNLASIVRSGGLELDKVVNVLEQATNALTAAHAAGVVHRDIKPSNVFVTPIPDGLHVTLLDFGVAKGVQKPLGNAVTLPGALLGTPGFMSPEQVMGREVGPATDVYALGCVAWLLITGREVFSAVADIDVMRMHCEDPVPPLATVTSVHRGLAEVVDAMLAKDPAQRPNAPEVRRRLARVRKDLSVPATVVRVRRTPPGTAQVTVKELPAVAEPVTPAKRRVWPIVLGVVVALLGLGGLVAWKLVL